MPGDLLAVRLRELRRDWPGGLLTQPALARALDVSVPLVSSWENGKAVPPDARLDDYARFFARASPAAPGRARLPGPDELTDDEQREYERLRDELLTLRGPASRTTPPGGSDRDAVPANPLRYGDSEPITIVCGTLSDALRSKIAYADKDSPDYVDSYKYADLDALVELLPRIGALNPTSSIKVGTWEELSLDDKKAHLIALGGVDFNPVMGATLKDLGELPVSQLERPTDSDIGGFSIRDPDGSVHQVRPVVTGESLDEDVAHFLRAPNPLQRDRTITFFGGQYSRGSYGVVRALTDPNVAERNAAYLRRRFGAAPTYSIVCRVRIVANEVVVPDWTIDADRLHEWPLPDAAAHQE